MRLSVPSLDVATASNRGSGRTWASAPVLVLLCCSGRGTLVERALAPSQSVRRRLQLPCREAEGIATSGGSAWPPPVRASSGRGFHARDRLLTCSRHERPHLGS